MAKHYQPPALGRCAADLGGSAPETASDGKTISTVIVRSNPNDASEHITLATAPSGVGGAASLPPLDRDRLRASVLIQHLRDARDLHYSRENRTILICFRSAVAAEWCWEALNGPAPRP